MNPPTPPLDKTAGDAAADDPDRLLLSALADGDGDAVERVCKGWQRDPVLRARWHAYHLIGDVLRSDELASTPRHDARVLEGVRARLAREPVLVAPLPQPAARGRAAAPWRVPVALAAGVAALAGVLLLAQGPDPGSRASGWQLAEMPAAPPAALRGASPGGAAGAAGAARSLAGSELLQVAAPTRAQMLREARIDEYLRAHRDVLAGSPAALPGGAMRAVDFPLPAR